MSHYKAYPAYKDSGVEWLGAVPEGWDELPLKHIIAGIESGTSVNATDTPASNGEWGVLKTSCVYSGIFDSTENKAIVPEEYDRASCRLRTGTLIVSRMNTPDLVGAAGLVAHSPEGIYLPDRLWQISFSDVLPSFAYYWSQSVTYRTQVKMVCTGTSSSMQNLSQDQFRNFVFGKPSLSEQIAIVAHLDLETARIDGLVGKKTRFIELLREKRQALITRAVTKGLDPSVKMKDSGVEWLGEVPEHWKVSKFRDVCLSISTGPFGTALGNDDYITNGIPIINPSHIQNNECQPDPDISVSEAFAEKIKFWAMSAGDIVTARRGELGRSAIITEEQSGWICGTGSLRVRPQLSKVTAQYLHSVLQSRYAREWLNQSSVGATMSNLNEDILGRLPVVLPPTIEEQNALLSLLEKRSVKLVEFEQKVEHSIALLKERRSALITAAVTGQIDLRDARAAPAVAPQYASA